MCWFIGWVCVKGTRRVLASSPQMCTTGELGVAVRANHPVVRWGWVFWGSGLSCPQQLTVSCTNEVLNRRRSWLHWLSFYFSGWVFDPSLHFFCSVTTDKRFPKTVFRQFERFDNVVFIYSCLKTDNNNNDNWGEINNEHVKSTIKQIIFNPERIIQYVYMGTKVGLRPQLD